MTWTEIYNFWLKFHRISNLGVQQTVSKKDWRLQGDKPLPEPMMIQFTEVFRIYIHLT